MGASDIQPVLAVVGLFVHQDAVAAITQEFLELKGIVFGDRCPKRFLDRALTEIKGSDLRSDIAGGNHKSRKRARKFISRSVEIMQTHRCELVGRVYIKKPGADMNGTSAYTTCIQYIAGEFEQFLTGLNSRGVMILDARMKNQDVRSSHAVFTQKHRQDGDRFSRILEAPTFGRSDNHIGLQLSDLIVSAVIYPMAVHRYCEGEINNSHIKPNYADIWTWYRHRIQTMQHRRRVRGVYSGGLAIRDKIKKRPGKTLFKD